MNDSSQEQALPRKGGLLSAGDLFKRSLQIYKDRVGIFVALAIASSILPSTTRLIVDFFEKLSLGAYILTTIIFVVIMVVISFWAQVATLYVIKEREQKIGFKEAIGNAWHKIIPYWWVSVLGGLAVLGGLLLLIVPGIIFAIWFSLGTYLVVAEDLKGTKALSRSKQLVQGRMLPVLWRFLFIGIFVLFISLIFNFIAELSNISAIESLPVLFTGPFVAIFGFLIYEELRNLSSLHD